ncbi:MAG: HIT family protein [Deltaproteobacteria bacterium]|nr:HIT family protein [Deltaproteobacteria bacterium]
MSCIFCRIVAGEIPAEKVYEDDHTLALMDINPVADGHLLVIPKSHHETLAETPEKVLHQVISVVKKMALALPQAAGTEHMNILQNNGKMAFQSVPHVHFHLIPRREGDGIGFGWRLVPGNPQKIQQTAQALRKALAP